MEFDLPYTIEQGINLIKNNLEPNRVVVRMIHNSPHIHLEFDDVADIQGQTAVDLLNKVCDSRSFQPTVWNDRGHIDIFIESETRNPKKRVKEK